MSPEALPPGSEIRGHRIIRMLGRGGFGITYCAQSPQGGLVAIKEFAPQGLAFRDDSGRIMPSTNDAEARETYAFLLDQFSREATRICDFDHPNVVHGISHHATTHSAHLIMRYETGLSLRQHLRQRNASLRITPGAMAKLLRGLMDALSYTHSKHCLHCDIKPGNIFIGLDHAPVLIDFGNARHAWQERCFSDDERLQSFTPYYAPIELTPATAGQHLGPWTDIYQTAAVLYRCITGGKIPAADDRLAARADDPFLPLTEYLSDHREWPRDFTRQIDQGLALQPNARPQSIAEWDRTLAPIMERLICSEPDHDGDSEDWSNPKPPAHAQVIESSRIADDEMRSTWTVITTHKEQRDEFPEETDNRTHPALKALIILIVAALIVMIVLVVAGHS